MSETVIVPRKRVVDVSVVAANYNNGRFLSEFLESCIRSTVSPLEWILVDDGSNDNSVSIANQFREHIPRLKIVRLDRNRGFAEALNVGVRYASGRYIARMDPDDVLLETRLERQYETIVSRGLDVLGGRAIYFLDSSGRDIWSSNCPLGHDQVVTALRRGDIGVVHASAMVRRELMREESYLQANVPAEDYDLYLRMLARGARFGNLPEPVIRVRVHGDSVSNRISLGTIRRTFELHDVFFGGQTSQFRIVMQFLHMRLYRKALFSGPGLARWVYLMCSAGFRLDKVWHKLWRRMS